MKIASISANNFRALKSVKIAKAHKLNVIVGPNAIGKSTLLDVIRLPKTVLAPRFSNEGQQTLSSIGALGPNNQVIGSRGVDIAGLANDPSQEISLAVELEFDDVDIAKLKSSAGPLAMMLIQAELGAASDGPLAFAQFLSTANGQKRMTEMMTTVGTRLNELSPGYRASLNLRMDPQQGFFRGSDGFANAMVTMLERRLPNHKALFSLFPADRALPQGDQAIQVGSGDAQQQLHSYMAQPGLKYARLKQAIIHSVLLRREGYSTLEAEFNLIFDNLLPGKKFAGVKFNDLGLLKIFVHDQRTNKTFDIDYMSSGEKGLALTFLFLRLSMDKGGIVLLDEPEMHLNAAVQAKLLPFLVEHCIKPMGLQAFVCTHSPEVVRAAFDTEDCGLFHLRASDDLTPVYRQDSEELFEIFERLGSSTAEVLFSNGSVFVEGPHDSAILQAGFGDTVSGFKITAVGGRAEIEREVPALQEQERNGLLTKVQLFILDNDRNPTGIKSSPLVRIVQLKRYCIENYLLNENMLFDLLKVHAKNDVESRGAFPKILEELALSQTAELAIWDTYVAMMPKPLGLRRQEVRQKGFDQVAGILATQLQEIRATVGTINAVVWERAFIEGCNSAQERLNQEWSAKWRDLCNGKQLIDDLYIKYQISMRKLEFKKEIIKRMAAEKTDDWRVLEQVLSSELTSTDRENESLEARKE